MHYWSKAVAVLLIQIFLFMSIPYTAYADCVRVPGWDNSYLGISSSPSNLPPPPLSSGIASSSGTTLSSSSASSSGSTSAMSSCLTSWIVSASYVSCGTCFAIPPVVSSLSTSGVFFDVASPSVSCHFYQVFSVTVSALWYVSASYSFLFGFFSFGVLMYISTPRVSTSIFTPGVSISTPTVAAPLVVLS